jgi:hypothetical protein
MILPMSRFTARIEPVPGGGHFVIVPEAAADAAGLAYRMRVRGTVDGAPYRSSLMKYSGKFHLGVHKATLSSAGVKVGDVVDIEIERDDEPLPDDTVPPALARALAKNAAAKRAWQSLAPSHRREHARHINEAKKEETRAARVEKTLKALLTAAKKR